MPAACALPPRPLVTKTDRVAARAAAPHLNLRRLMRLAEFHALLRENPRGLSTTAIREILEIRSDRVRECGDLLAAAGVAHGDVWSLAGADGLRIRLTPFL